MAVNCSSIVFIFANDGGAWVRHQALIKTSFYVVRIKYVRNEGCGPVAGIVK